MPYPSDGKNLAVFHPLGRGSAPDEPGHEDNPQGQLKALLELAAPARDLGQIH